MTRTTARRIATYAGRLIAVAAVVFVVVSVQRQWHAIADRHLSTATWVELAAAGIVYGFLYLFIGEAWHRLASDFTQSVLSRRLTVASYAVSQLAKYVPGNIFSYIGRHAYMSRGGVANAPLLKALSWEIVFQLISAQLVIIITILLLPTSLKVLPADLLRDIALAAGAVVLVTTVLLLTNRRFAAMFGSVRPRVETAVTVILLHMAFFSCQALVFTMLGFAIEGRMIFPLMTVGVASWLVGFIPFGTPAGIGTREAMVLLLAGPLIGAADALLLAALFRFTTTIGDVVCFGLGHLIARSGKTLEPVA